MCDGKGVSKIWEGACSEIFSYLIHSKNCALKSRVRMAKILSELIVCADDTSYHDLIVAWAAVRINFFLSNREKQSEFQILIEVLSHREKKEAWRPAYRDHSDHQMFKMFKAFNFRPKLLQLTLELDDASRVSDEVVAATCCSEILSKYHQLSLDPITSGILLARAHSWIQKAHVLEEADYDRLPFGYLYDKISMSLFCQWRPLKHNLDSFTVEMNKTPTGKWEWANTIIWITAEVMAFSFGWEKSWAEFEGLKLKAGLWWQQKPLSFQPIHIRKGRICPDVYYCQSWHGMEYLLPSGHFSTLTSP